MENSKESAASRLSPSNTSSYTWQRCLPILLTLAWLSICTNFVLLVVIQADIIFKGFRYLLLQFLLKPFEIWSRNYSHQKECIPRIHRHRHQDETRIQCGQY